MGGERTPQIRSQIRKSTRGLALAFGGSKSEVHVLLAGTSALPRSSSAFSENTARRHLEPEFLCRLETGP
jgi:hypothetical protein